ncbi:glycoside hydrolase family 43 [Lecanosticta acicola]|uniref:Endo-1,5-alpha-L-arabinanase A n=1 Tax=Lecanosticta acicola TaxID=111012 RepID=A0AAI8YSZ2_9PEZI|nr:glycoside hydrolase family 43 [Lecanosticta acicola]
MLITWLSLSIFSLLAQPTLCAPIRSRGATLEHRLSKRTIAGPKIDGANFPDPSIINVNDVWYAFATRTIGSTIHVQVATSTDFETWSMRYNDDGSQFDALPDLPSWVDDSTVLSSKVWGPDVNVLDDGTYIMYYSATTTSDNTKHCVAAATSSTVQGPYTPQSGTLFCPLAKGGAIDPAGFNDNGQRYIVYKVDGNSIGNGGSCGNDVSPYVSTALLLQPVTSDGYTLQGTATTLLDNAGASDQGIVEAPALVKSGSTYVLFFSSGCYTTGNYNVDYATASSLEGPYTRAGSALIVTGTSGLTAPGGADVTKDGERLIFHATYGSGRALYTSTIQIADEAVTQA